MPVLWALVSGNADTDAEEAARMLEARRHKTFKIKMGFGGAEPEKRCVVRTARANHQLAPEAHVTDDLTQAGDMRTGMRLPPQIDDAGIAVVEKHSPSTVERRAGRKA